MNGRRLTSVLLRKCGRAALSRHRLSTASLGLWTLLACFPAHAQSANQPGYDPRQTERRFEVQQSSQGANGRPRLPSPQFARPEGQGDSKPLFVLQHVSITGAVALPQDRLAATYQSYIGKKVSQADLAAIAAAVSDVYRAAGFHLSRAIVPPQDIQGGQLSIQVIEGSITELALKGDGTEQFGVRPMLDAVLTERPSQLATLERQLLLINGRPGVQIEDTAIEEIGTASGHFRLILSLKTWHLFTSVGVDNLGSSSVEDEQRTGRVRRELGATALAPVPATARDARVVAPHDLTGLGMLHHRLPVSDGLERFRARGAKQAW